MNLRELDYSVEQGVRRLADDPAVRKRLSWFVMSKNARWVEWLLTAEEYGTTVGILDKTLEYLYSRKAQRYGDYFTTVPA